MNGRDGERHAVLVPTGFAPGSYSCVRSLGSRGIHTIVGTEYDTGTTVSSRYCGERVRIPPPQNDLVAYKDALLDIAARPSVRTILPLRPYDPYVLSKYHDEFDPYVSIPVPHLDTLNTVFDRLKLYEAATELDVPVPETWTVDETDELHGKYIVKSRYNLLVSEYLPSYAEGKSNTAKSVLHVDQGILPDTASTIEEMNHVPIVQEYVRHDNQYVFGALYDHGEPKATFQHRQLRGLSYTGGGGVYRETISDPELEAVGRQLLDGLEWHGLACIEYAKDAYTGEYKLLEINPRLWQSVPCAVRAGADFPFFYWCLALGNHELIDPTYRLNVRTHFLLGELRYLRSLLNDESDLVDRPSFAATAWDIAASCIMYPYFDNLRWDDPLPFLHRLGHVYRTKR